MSAHDGGGMNPTPYSENPDRGDGLHAPAGVRGLGKVFWWLRFGLLVQLARLRFFAILAVIGLVIVKWDAIDAYYQKWMRPGGEAEAAGDHEYFCPMHPTVVRNNKKDKCPICFMPLSKRKKGQVSDESLPAGVVSRVQLSPYRVVLAGARTMPVSYQPLVKEITTVGTVEFDETELYNVPSRVKGRIDKLLVNQTGQLVTKGQPLALLYSPDLVVTVENLLNAKQSKNEDLQMIARNRLILWGIDEKQIDDIVASGKPITHLTIKSPITGHVIKKYVKQGQYVEEGGTIYDVAEISTVWLQAQMYEDDLAFLPGGSHDPKTGLVGRKLDVVATTRAFPGRQFDGTLSFMFPHVDQETRTLTVRFELKNKEHELRPGMTATVTLRLTPEQMADLPAGRRLQIQDGKVLAVPETSVIDTGKQKVVFREELPNTFDGISVELGSRMSGPNGEAYFPILVRERSAELAFKLAVPYIDLDFPVLPELKPSDLVVAAGSFLIDAETRLNPAMGSIYIGGSGSGSGTGGAIKSNPAAMPQIRPSSPEDKDAKITIALSKLAPADKAVAMEQKWCPILEGTRLGEMEVPVKVELDGKPVFICCKGCVKQAKDEPEKTLARVVELKQRAKQPSTSAPKPDRETKIRDNLAKLSPEDRKLAEAQKICPITDGPLGSMGVPPKLMVKGQVVFTCCKGCNADVEADPDANLKKVEGFKAKYKSLKK